MATGDNGLTAISVARNCGIINLQKPAYLAELVTSGKGHKHIKWIEITHTNLDEVDEARASSKKKGFLVKSQSTEQRESVNRLSMVAGFAEFKSSKYL